jgi:hypothetical protein
MAVEKDNVSHTKYPEATEDTSVCRRPSIVETAEAVFDLAQAHPPDRQF